MEAQQAFYPRDISAQDAATYREILALTDKEIEAISVGEAPGGSSAVQADDGVGE